MKSERMRRLVVGSVLVGTMFTLVSIPFSRVAADSSHEYTAQMGFMLESLRRTLVWLEMFRGNRDLANVVHPLTEEFVRLAGRMTPPDKLRPAHPHLVLAAENVERAAFAATRGDLQMFRARVRNVRDELRVLENVLHHLQVKVPEIPH